MDYRMNRALKKIDKTQKIKTWEEILKEHSKFYLLDEKEAKQDKHLTPPLYKRTLLNPEGKGNLRIELIEYK